MKQNIRKNDKKVINRSKKSFSPFYLHLVKNLPKTLVFYLIFGDGLRSPQGIIQRTDCVKEVSISSSIFSMD